jgi:hypothetical protein
MGKHRYPHLLITATAEVLECERAEQSAAQVAREGGAAAVAARRGGAMADGEQAAAGCGGAGRGACWRSRSIAAVGVVGRGRVAGGQRPAEVRRRGKESVRPRVEAGRIEPAAAAVWAGLAWERPRRGGSAWTMRRWGRAVAE